MRCCGSCSRAQRASMKRTVRIPSCRFRCSTMCAEARRACCSSATGRRITKAHARPLPIWFSTVRSDSSRIRRAVVADDAVDSRVPRQARPLSSRPTMAEAQRPLNGRSTASRRRARRTSGSPCWVPIPVRSASEALCRWWSRLQIRLDGGGRCWARTTGMTFQRPPRPSRMCWVQTPTMTISRPASRAAPAAGSFMSIMVT